MGIFRCNVCMDRGCKHCKGEVASELQERKSLEDYKPKVPRPGTELIAYTSQRIVDIIEFQGQFLVATEYGVYRMEKDEHGEDIFKPIKFEGGQNENS